MRAIDRPIWTFREMKRGHYAIKLLSKAEEVGKGKGVPVSDYADLFEKVAKLSYYNPDFVLFFRGQANDFKDDILKRSTLQPTIFRPKRSGKSLGELALRRRFNTLNDAESLLSETYPFRHEKNIKRNPLLRWSLLQHYGVCPTPLLDVTQTLSVACSFAHISSKKGGAFLYVLALPQINQSITVDISHGIHIIRLLSICPPDALRPHYQEGFLLGEYPFPSQEAVVGYEIEEFDFSRRLLCKFRLPPSKDFWSEDFKPIATHILFPESRDRFVPFMNGLKEELED